MKNKILCIGIILLGIAALAVGIISMNQIKEYIPAEAVITRIDSEYNTASEEYEYDVYISYEIDGEKHEDVQLGYYQDGFKEGKTIKIKYCPDDHTKIIADSPAFYIYLIVIGAIVILVGLFISIRGKAKLL